MSFIGGRGNCIEQQDIIPIKTRRTDIILNIKIAQSLPSARLYYRLNHGPEGTLAEAFRAAGALAPSSVCPCEASVATKLLKLADGNHLRMGVLHQIEQRGAAVAQACDENDLWPALTYLLATRGD